MGLRLPILALKEVRFVKPIVLGFVLLALAVLSRLFFTASWDIGWKVNEQMTRGFAVRDVLFWTLMTGAGALIIFGVLKRFRAEHSGAAS